MGKKLRQWSMKLLWAIYWSVCIAIAVDFLFAGWRTKFQGDVLSDSYLGVKVLPPLLAYNPPITDPFIRFIAGAAVAIVILAVFIGCLVLVPIMFVVFICLLVLEYIYKLSPAGAMFVQGLAVLLVFALLYYYRRIPAAIVNHLIEDAVWVVIAFRWIFRLDRRKTASSMMVIGDNMDKKNLPVPSHLEVAVSTGSNPVGKLVSNKITRVVAESQAKTDEELLKAVKRRDELIQAMNSLRNSGVRSEKERLQMELELMKAEDAIEEIRRARKERVQAEEAKSRPPTISIIDRMKEENEALKLKAEKLKLDAEIAKHQAELQRINQPQEKPRSQPQESSIDKMLRELEKEQEDKHKIERWANEMAQKYPDQKDYYDRLAKKKIEELKDRNLR